ncbi:fimbria biosynthesis transcriptional regulator FimZ [Escherichia albertii]|uniref:fimbria biosynthesis transcriptional regulator FimZ n=1 Tax=Escherichia albertii TaxID=208962 RepID=UPI00237B63B7|nr:fimbria biosynthesis transcriptional regulator FimZ [Escherichia albertii]MDD9747529.1 fimbria biosynthesis transcriptional regulator FimZ [Escherichia albertii]
MRPASVIVMDTHPIIRMSIEVLLEKHDNLQIVLKTDDHRITIDYLRCHSVDLIIMDIDLPGIDGFTFLKKIKQIQSTTRVLFLSSKTECFYAGRAIQAGASGFVSKCHDQNDIFHAVQMILAGYTFFPSETIHYIKNSQHAHECYISTPLTNREVTILRYLVNGLSNKEIAGQLLLSNKTVSAHKSNIYSKLGLHSIVELINYARLYELI